LSNDPTRTSPVPSDAPSSQSRGGGRFVAGTVLADRYRIVTLLGAGGMGEVYKAEDIKLEHPVALKFLPETLSLSPGALARFHGEVRIARQVSHPNVCRVFDIGAIDGLNFMTMEFIDGEDLASLLRRIGRLPSDKAVEVARQLCAGLAAAHDAGVLHRDLKPHNVMIDGRGKARITDFGIAALAREVRQENIVAGTPAYMAPEQLRGEESTVRSDIYSLGLILYEIFTGKRAIQAGTLAEAVLHHSAGSTVTSPSRLVQDVDPIVERVILRCLEKDPAMRPASAIQVAAALPGGDPLHAALAAGEMPSPEMVAASGSSAALKPALAVAIAAIAMSVLIITGIASSGRTLHGLTPHDASPEVMAYRAREVLTSLGYADRGADSAFGFAADTNYLLWDRQSQPPDGRIQRLRSIRPPSLPFWYRESPTLMSVLYGGLDSAGPPVMPDLSLVNPPFSVRGMRYLKLDAMGRLVEFGALPVSDDGSRAPATPMKWDDLFRVAGLDQTTFTSVPTQGTPAVAADQQAAWTGVYPERPDLPIRLEAAAYKGRLVAFRVLGPWGESAAIPRIAPLGNSVFSLALIFIGMVLGWINTRAGRGDRRGAFRLATVVFFLSLSASMLSGHHVAGREEMQQIRVMACLALFNAAIMYVSYLAIEPHVRRRWPEVLVGWSRLLVGQIRDPLVGRDVLIGMALAAAAAVAHYLLAQATSLTMDADVAMNSFVATGRALGVFPRALEGAISV
jgi:Protein kinase domain